MFKKKETTMESKRDARISGLQKELVDLRFKVRLTVGVSSVRERSLLSPSLSLSALSRKHALLHLPRSKSSNANMLSTPIRKCSPW